MPPNIAHSAELRDPDIKNNTTLKVIPDLGADLLIDRRMEEGGYLVERAALLELVACTIAPAIDAAE
jgi:hypothetical protein